MFENDYANLTKEQVDRAQTIREEELRQASERMDYEKIITDRKFKADEAARKRGEVSGWAFLGITVGLPILLAVGYGIVKFIDWIKDKINDKKTRKSEEKYGRTYYESNK